MTAIVSPKRFRQKEFIDNFKQYRIRTDQFYIFGGKNLRKRVPRVFNNFKNEGGKFRRVININKKKTINKFKRPEIL